MYAASVLSSLLYVARRAPGGAFPDARRTSLHEPAFL